MFFLASSNAKEWRKYYSLYVIIVSANMPNIAYVKTIHEYANFCLLSYNMAFGLSFHIKLSAECVYPQTNFNLNKKKIRIKIRIWMRKRNRNRNRMNNNMNKGGESKKWTKMKKKKKRKWKAKRVLTKNYEWQSFAILSIVLFYFTWNKITRSKERHITRRRKIIER